MCLVDALGELHIRCTVLVDGVAGGLPKVANNPVSEEIDFEVLGVHVHCNLDRDFLIRHERNVALEIAMLVASDGVLRALAPVSKDGDLSSALCDVVHKTHLDNRMMLSRPRVVEDG